MRTLVWAVAAVLIAGLMVAEFSMELTADQRRQLYLVFSGLAGVTFLAAWISLKIAGRFKSLRTSLQVVAFAAVAVTAAVVAVASLAMFIEPHDLTLVLVALVLGVGLGGVVAAAVARPLTGDLSTVSTVARQVAAGDLSARTGIVRDDELGAAARAFDKMVNDLQASDEERRNLLTAIGHDLRTPLASMQAAVEALQDGVASDPAAFLSGLGHDLDYVRHLVDDLFLLSRLDAGRLEVSPIALDLSELADEAVEAIGPIAMKRGVRLAVQSPGRLGVIGDPAALGRVFRNLLDNPFATVLTSVKSGLNSPALILGSTPSSPIRVRDSVTASRNGSSIGSFVPTTRETVSLADRDSGSRSPAPSSRLMEEDRDRGWPWWKSRVRAAAEDLGSGAGGQGSAHLFRVV